MRNGENHDAHPSALNGRSKVIISKLIPVPRYDGKNVCFVREATENESAES
jgi:hypothetical protein